MNTGNEWIKALNLEKHPEGGYYRETYRSKAVIDTCCSGSEFDGPRSVGTGIYFLLAGDEFSAFHRIRSDEIWHHYAGSDLSLHVINQAGAYRTICLGKDMDRGEMPQVVVPAGQWFGATLRDPTSYVLAGCTVSPGFDFRDFDLGNREDLIRLYPKNRPIIEALTFK